MSAQEWVDPEVLNLTEICITFLGKVGGGFSEATLQSCEGDLVLICNALDDYARLCDTFRERERLTGFQASTYEYYAARFRTISEKMAAGIGYDKEATIAKCKKRQEKAGDGGDIGEEAMALLVKHGTPASRKAKQAEQAEK